MAGDDACHELAACMLAATIRDQTSPHILVVGAGGGAQEIVTASMLEPSWHFTAVDPSPPMMDIAFAQLERNGLAAQTEVHIGYVDDLPADQRFHAATLIGVLHHQPGEQAKRQLLASIATRLRPGAPLILAGNRYAYASQPLLLRAWGERWRMQGATADEMEAKLGRILEGADPPVSEDAVARLLADTGFEPPIWFFSSLFWGACLAKRTNDSVGNGALNGASQVCSTQPPPVADSLRSINWAERRLPASHRPTTPAAANLPSGS